jgi:hypothetical protein
VNDDKEMGWTLDPRSFKPKLFRVSWQYVSKSGSLKQRTVTNPPLGRYETEAEAEAAAVGVMRRKLAKNEELKAEMLRDIEWRQKRVDGLTDEAIRLRRLLRKHDVARVKGAVFPSTGGSEDVKP